jgi:effector-binding domain-containing protein
MTKTIIITLFIILLAMGLFAFKSDGIEMPSYRMIKKYGDVEIRQYPAMVIAQTQLSQSSVDNNMNNGFRTIAGYIFGGNDQNQKIAMTAPVVMKMSDTATMYFMMPKKYSVNQLPKPNSNNVKILEESSRVLAVIRYGGFSSEKKIEKYQKQLAEVISQNNLKTKGPYMYMGYNAPWDVFNRRNEVAIEVVE